MKFHDELNPVIWDKDNNNEMRPEVKDKLNEIADAFIEFIDIPDEAILDMVITGSSASYNYNEHSDLDLHIIVDYDKIHEDCPLVEGYLGALKNTFNKEHDIFIHGVPVELYAEKKDQGTVHNGLYSLKDEKWIDIPRKIPPTTNDAAVEAKYQEIKDMVDKCDDSEAANELLEKIYKMRKAGLSEVGEFSTENLAFKKLRNDGCMDKLRQLKKEKIDKQLSLESYNESTKTGIKKQVFNNRTHVNEEYINVSSGLYIKPCEPELEEEFKEAVKQCKSLYEFERKFHELAQDCEICAEINDHEYCSFDLEDLCDNIEYGFENSYVETTIDEWIVKEDKVYVGYLTLEAGDDDYEDFDESLNEEDKPKRYKMHISDVVSYLVGDYVDISDYYLNGDKFTIVYSEDGETEEKYTISTKDLEKELGVKNLIWKSDKEGLDRIVYEKEDISESIKKLNIQLKKLLGE